MVDWASMAARLGVDLGPELLGHGLDLLGFLLALGVDLGDHLVGLGLGSLFLEDDLGLGLGQLGLGLGGQLLLLAGLGQLVGDLGLLDRLANGLGHVDVPGQAEEERQVLGRQHPLELLGGLVLELLAGVADQQVHRASPRAVEPADRVDLRQDHLLLDVFERAELADDVGGLVGEDAPDRREVEVDREAVVGGELDSLARDVDRIVGRRSCPAGRPRARPRRRSVGLSPVRFCGFHHQGRLGIADADDVDPLLLGIEEVDAGLEHLLLDAAVHLR